jgi:hypothetical protein
VLYLAVAATRRWQYERTLADLPWAAACVVVHLRVRRTARLTERMLRAAFALGGDSGAPPGPCWLP